MQIMYCWSWWEVVPYVEALSIWQHRKCSTQWSLGTDKHDPVKHKNARYKTSCIFSLSVTEPHRDMKAYHRDIQSQSLTEYTCIFNWSWSHCTSPSLNFLLAHTMYFARLLECRRHWFVHQPVENILSVSRSFPAPLSCFEPKMRKSNKKQKPGKNPVRADVTVGLFMSL